MKKIIMAFLLLSKCVTAGQYPVVTSITSSWYGNRVTVHLNQALQEIGPASEQIISAGQKVGVFYKYYNNGAPQLNLLPDSAYGFSYVQDTNGRTSIGDLAVTAYNMGGQRAVQVQTVIHDGDNLEVCAGYMSATQMNGSVYNWNSSIRPAGCTIAPPPADWCKITTPEIVLDHGTVTLQNAEGSQATANVNIQCTSQSDVSFSLLGDNYVYLDDGKSEITVNDQPLGTPISLNAGDTQLQVKDTLSGVTKEGPHTGSSVLMISPY